MKNPKAPLRTSETSYLLFQQIMSGVSPSVALEATAPQPKAKITPSGKKSTKASATALVEKATKKKAVKK